MDNIRTRGRGRRGRGRGRLTTRRKKSFEKKEDSLPSAGEEDDTLPSVVNSPQIVDSPSQTIAPPLDMEADISQLEAPTFTTLSRGPPEPMLRLKWSHAVNLIGEKVLNPMIHCCDTCLRPILVYGRMIPCKHVFCLACAHRENKQCRRCNDKVVRVEQTGLGTVFMCTHGGSRYGNNGCRRTYLSQRDLQAHINHRHVAGGVAAVSMSAIPVQCNKIEKLPPIVPTSVPPSTPHYQPPKVKLYGETDVGYGATRLPPDSPVVSGPPPQIIRPPGPTGNLITVPIQEPPPEPYFKIYPQPQQSMPYFPPTFDYPPPDTSVPPPNQWPGNPPFYG